MDPVPDQMPLVAIQSGLGDGMKTWLKETSEAKGHSEAAAIWASRCGFG